MAIRMTIVVTHHEWEESDVERNLEAIFDPQEAWIESIKVENVKDENE